MNVGIIGIGVVGGAIRHGFEKLGHNVVVHDVKHKTKIEDVIDTDIVFVCVPTPSAPSRSSCLELRLVFVYLIFAFLPFCSPYLQSTTPPVLATSTSSHHLSSTTDAVLSAILTSTSHRESKQVNQSIKMSANAATGSPTLRRAGSRAGSSQENFSSAEETLANLTARRVR